MRALWEKAKKEATIAGDSALKTIGVVKDPEDPDFVSRDATLARLDSSATTLLGYLETFAFDVETLAETSNTVRETLKDPEMPTTQIQTITSVFIDDQIRVKCIKPLQEFLERAHLLAAVKTKRFRNRSLMHHLSGEEAQRRTEKYLRYHTAFINGVDALSSKHGQLLALVFHHQQHYMKEYITALHGNLLQSGPGVAFAPAVFPAYPDQKTFRFYHYP
jgi:hypothetical protein